MNKKIPAFAMIASLILSLFWLNVVHAGVYDDCTAWWHFDYDADSDGKADLDEIRDQRDWSKETSTGKHATQVYGSTGGPGWTNQTVICPAGGQDYGRKSMYFNPAVNSATNCYPDTFRAGIGLAGSATIVTRLFWDGIATVDSVSQMAWIINNNLEWNAYRGWLFGIRGGTSPTLSIYAQRGESRMDIAMTTNAWYDIAVVLTDGGTNTPTDTIEFYLWKEGGALSYVKKTTTLVTNSIGSAGIIIGCENAGGSYAASNNRKAFKGAINHMALWNRALSFNEVNEALGNPKPLFQIGLRNNSPYDLRVESQIDAVYWPGDPWHTMRRGLTASNPDATLRMELNALQSALDYAFHIRSDSSDGGQTAAIELIVNSNTYPLKNIGTDNDYFWHIPNNLLITGTNTFTMHYAAGPAAYITFDWMELGGSWQVGTNDNSKEEFIVEGSAPDDFYVTNPNWKHLERALTAGDPEIDIHFTLSPEMIAKYTYLYTTRVIEQESGHPHPFTIGCNDTVIQTYPDNGLPNGTLVSIPIPPELLLPGDNAINLIYTGSSSYMQFDFHRLDLKKFPSGTIILIR